MKSGDFITGINRRAIILSLIFFLMPSLCLIPTTIAHGYTITYSYNDSGSMAQQIVDNFIDTLIATHPLSPANSSDASFSFTSTNINATFECKLDSGVWAACNSGTSTYSTLSGGSHIFNVKSTGTAGNTDATPALFAWTVDTIAPDTTITGFPADPANSSNASFSFTATEANATFQCRMDGGSYAVCASPAGYSALTDGPHTFSVKAIDVAGNPDLTPASYTWTIDTAHAVVVNKSGAGSGSVTSSPAGITCGVDCDEAYSTGTVVTLAALADSGSLFAGWSGGGCSGTGNCAVTVNGSTTMIATFDACSDRLVRIMRGGTPVQYYTSLQVAYNDAINGDIIQSQAVLLTGSFNAGDASSKSITVEGGYNCSYTDVIGKTELKGQVTIDKGTNRFKNLIIKK